MKISVVVPVHNEQESLPPLFERMSAALRALGMDYEVLLIDDGSTDGSLAVLEGLHERDARWSWLSFSRRFGHQLAVSAGIQYSTGDLVAVMDADLQDPPEALASLVEKWREGYQVVYGVRCRRKENVVKRLCYALFYRVLRFATAVKIPLDAGDFCVMDRAVADALCALPERTRFVRGLRAWVGFRQIGVSYERGARLRGASKYSFFKLMSLALDGVVSLSSFPLRLVSGIGAGLCLLSLVLMGLVVAWRLSDTMFWGMQPRNALGWTSIVALVLFLSGLQILLVSFVGEYLSRIYDEVKGRAPYIIARAKGISPKPGSVLVGWHIPKPR